MVKSTIGLAIPFKFSVTPYSYTKFIFLEPSGFSVSFFTAVSSAQSVVISKFLYNSLFEEYI